MRQQIITIPKNVTKGEELMIISRKVYMDLLKQASESRILRLSKEARLLKKMGRLPKLESLADLEK